MRLLRYVVARFSAYPIVMWDTGIDIGEARNHGWIDWFANWFNANDPWQHPVGSRSGGGSGGKHPDNGTYWSDGALVLPDHHAFVTTWKSRRVATAFTDRWREDYSRGNFDRAQIRRAVWEIGLVGGSAVYVSGNNNGGYLGADYASDFQAAPDCGYAARFFRNEINALESLEPHDELVSAGDAVLSAHLHHEYVAYLWRGGAVTLNFQHTAGLFDVRWYNPRSGQFTAAPGINGGAKREFLAPNHNDWVLHVQKSAPEMKLLPPSPPTALQLW
jgi:hypothetical protein